MNGINNTLNFIFENWSNLVFIAAFLFILINRVRSFFALSKEDQVEAALKVVRTQLLKFMSEAEINWKDFEKSGAIKKSEVITRIYQEFPILKEYVDQDTLIQTIVDMINEGMAEMNKIINGIKAPKIEDIVVETTTE